MVLANHTLDLTDRVTEINDRLDEIDTEIEALTDEVRAAVDESNADDPHKLDNWDEYERRFDDLDNEKISITGERRKFWETVVDWETDTDVAELREEYSSNDDMDGYWEEITDLYATVDSCAFEVRELSFGQLQSVSDDMMEESFDVDMQRQDVEGTPHQGYYQIQLLKEAIVGWPDSAPTQTAHGIDTPSPGDYPIPVSEWLFERVDAINTTGNTEMGNSSLEEALSSKR